ncbi:MAG: hypothetical protein NC033_03665 [Clostridiales bacterium]|nr:hypothetical protein [Clostridiales bacterium]
MKSPKSEIDKRYEEKHKEERKARHLVWGTSIDREYAETINKFLKENKLTKVELVVAGYEALKSRCENK